MTLTIKRLRPVQPETLSRILLAGASTLLILAGTAHPLFSALAFLLCCWTMLRDEYEGMLQLFFLMPMAQIFKLSPTSTSLFTYLEILYILVHYLKKRLFISRADVAVLILCFVMVLTELLSGTVAVTATVKVLLNLLLIERFLDLMQHRESKQLYLWFVMGVIVSSWISLVRVPVFPVGDYVTGTYIEWHGDGTYVARFTGLSGDPNYYAINVVISLCLLIVLYRKREISLGTMILAVGNLGLFAAITGSKSAILMLCIVGVLFLISLLQGKHYLLFLLVVSGLVLVFQGAVSGQIGVLKGTVSRLTSSLTDLDSLTTGRLGIWINYLTYFWNNPLEIILGNGVGIPLLEERAAHNTYIDLIYQLGLVGSGLYLGTLLQMMRSRTHRLRRNILSWSVFICIMMMYFFLSQLQGYGLPFQLALGFLVWNTVGRPAAKASGAAQARYAGLTRRLS